MNLHTFPISVLANSELHALVQRPGLSVLCTWIDITPHQSHLDSPRCALLLSVSQCTLPCPKSGPCPCFSWSLIYLVPTVCHPFLIGKSWCSSSLSPFLPFFSFCVCVCVCKPKVTEGCSSSGVMGFGAGDQTQVLLHDKLASVCLLSPRKKYLSPSSLNPTSCSQGAFC